MKEYINKSKNNSTTSLHEALNPVVANIDETEMRQEVSSWIQEFRSSDTAEKPKKIAELRASLSVWRNKNSDNNPFIASLLAGLSGIIDSKESSISCFRSSTGQLEQDSMTEHNPFDSKTEQELLAFLGSELGESDSKDYGFHLTGSYTAPNVPSNSMSSELPTNDPSFHTITSLFDSSIRTSDDPRNQSRFSLYSFWSFNGDRTQDSIEIKREASSSKCCTCFGWFR